MRIKQLPPAIANQIAAGEVIERPASVVKELLENALDAGATEIAIDISYGGLLQIKVSDNGAGILAEDLPLAVSAHATSKITTLNDLYAIESMGFRGEALASIASVAKLMITSRPNDQENAMMLTMTGADYQVHPCPRTVGTTVEVLDLFYNAPVRKRFLKGEKIEFQAIEMLIKRFALSAPSVAISLKHNKKIVLTLPSALNEHTQNVRRAKIFGSAFMKESLYIESQRGAMTLRGWISNSNLQRSQSDRQWIYLNQRMVKDKLLQHALKQAYDEMLHPGRFPLCLLYFDLPTEEVDVNVHPTKHEVRFQQPRLVHDFLSSEIRRALQSNPPPVELTTKSYSISRPTALDIFEPSLVKEADFKQNPYAVEEDNWIVLNEQFVLIRKHQSLLLVDALLAYKQWLLQTLHATKLPLNHRPLLVPIRMQLGSSILTDEEKLVDLGIQLEKIEDNHYLIRSIPMAIPYLDLHALFRELAKGDYSDISALLELLSNSQSFDANTLSTQERHEINLWLLTDERSMNSKKGLAKTLSIEDCRILMHD